MHSSTRVLPSPEAAPDSPSLRTAAPISLAHRRLAAFWGSTTSRVSLVVTVLLLLLAVYPTSWLPYDPTVIDFAAANQPGFWAGNFEHPLGTDFLGRDMACRLVFATDLTLVVSGGALVLASILGIGLGLLAGFYGGWMDEGISWLVDVQLAFPVMALAAAVVAMLGGSVWALIVVLATTGWCGIARVARAETMVARGQDYVLAAHALGASGPRILLAHVLPNLISPVLVVATFLFARFVLTESALSFLGLGIGAPQATWGSLIGDGRQYIYQSWWTAAVPGCAITTLVVAFNLLGDGLRDAWDPHTLMRGR
jgi:ABC-type dipeptide/oligopeptide/nickel transport system permease subunit